jgi:hypothetical protein
MMYRSLALIIILLMLPTAHAQEQWEHPDSRLGVVVFNFYGRQLAMKMYSQNRPGKEWGPYEIPPNVEWHAPRIIIDCKEEEKICLGASAGNMQTGFDPERGCNDCCLRCDGYGHMWQIIGNGGSLIPRHRPSELPPG